jgi:hypothetical protein
MVSLWGWSTKEITVYRYVWERKVNTLMCKTFIYFAVSFERKPRGVSYVAASGKVIPYACGRTLPFV